MSTPPKGDPARGWQAIEAMNARDDAEWFEKATDEEIEKRMNEAGVKVTKVPTADEFLARMKERAAAPAPGAQVVALPSRRGRRAVWIAGLALAAGTAGIFIGRSMSGPDVVTGGRPLPTPETRARAAALRQEAFAACDAKHWEVCGAKLDDARDLDAQGEDDPRVVAARKAIAEGEGR